jgi:hypothetical protein
MLGNSFSGWGIDPCPLTDYNSLSSHLRPMTRFPLAMCSDLQTRQIKWISRADQLKNGSRPSQYIHWGVPATAIAAQYSEAHAGQG